MTKGPIIDDREWRKLMVRLRELDGKQVNVGLLGNVDSEIVGIGIIHEFGAPGANIPERSFIRRTFWDRGPLKVTCRKLMERIVLGRLLPDAALKILGLWAVNQIKATIRNRIPPPLKPATIAAKGSDVPLIDTGRLLNSIQFEVTKKT